MLMDPTLIRRLSALEAESQNTNASVPLTAEEARRFTDELFEEYRRILSGETPVLHKMKEFWTWLVLPLPDHEKLLKKIVKAKNFREYRAAADAALTAFQWKC